MKQRLAQRRKALAGSGVALLATALFVLTGIPEALLLPLLVAAEGIVVHEVTNDPPAEVVPPHDNLA